MAVQRKNPVNPDDVQNFDPAIIRHDAGKSG